MITKFGHYISSILILILIVSCHGQGEAESSSVQAKQTINIRDANTDIKKSVGIDLLDYKAKVDTLFDTDSFYVSVCEELLFNTGQSTILNELGPFTVFDNGDSILYNQRDSLFTTIFHCIGNNFYLGDCVNNNLGATFCNFKKNAQKRFLSVKSIYTLTLTNTFGDIYDQFKKGNLNYDELSYMVIVHHLLHDISTLEK